ncbi:MAG: glycosyltransferase family 8 protein [Synergistaceae bacterium]|jgi:lipopolysaccharide biosynthesis glycosyltransferase|nr:glycosyltransferase family 8 protein [Synergistaceae bacterium]
MSNLPETSEAKDLIHVALAIYDPKGTYARHTGVVMTSMFEHTTSSVCVHILHDQTLTERNRSFLNETAELFGQQAAFHDVSSHIERAGSEAVRRARIHANSLGALFRLLIPEILLLDKVIYLDSDVIVNTDIRDLWNIGVEGYSFAGALDRPISSRYRRFSFNAFRLRLLKCDCKKYVNSGVLYMNLPRIREKFQLSRQGASWYKRYAHCSSLVDQDLINSYFCGDIKIIDSRFNNCYAQDGDISNAILHAIGAAKPWNGLKGSALDRLYWKTYLKTPWGRLAPDEIADLLIDVIRDSPYTHRHTVLCYRKIFSRVWKDFICNGIVKIVLLFLKDLYHRAKFQTTATCRILPDASKK